MNMTVSKSHLVGYWLALIGGILSAGCSGSGGKPTVAIDHSSQRMLMVTFDQAIRKSDYPAIYQAIDPAYRGQYRSMAQAGRDYLSALDSLAGTVEVKIGPKQAKRFADQAQRLYSGLFPSPLAGATTDNGVNWDIVRVLDEGQCFAVTVGGKSTDFDKQYVLQQAKGLWFIAPHQRQVPPDRRVETYKRQAAFMRKNLMNYVSLTNDLNKKVKAGLINKDNFDQKMADLKAAAQADMKARQ
jgi:hypothetical protein